MSIDKVAEDFWRRYSNGKTDYRPPIVNNIEGRLKAVKYLEEIYIAEANELSEVAKLRFKRN